MNPTLDGSSKRLPIGRFPKDCLDDDDAKITSFSEDIGIVQSDDHIRIDHSVSIEGFPPRDESYRLYGGIPAVVTL